MCKYYWCMIRLFECVCFLMHVCVMVNLYSECVTVYIRADVQPLHIWLVHTSPLHTHGLNSCLRGGVEGVS